MIDASTSIAVQPRVAGQVRVAHVAERLIVAGMGHVIASLVRGMPPLRYQSAIWCLEEADILGQKLQSEGHEVLQLGRCWRRDFALLIRMASLIRRKRIDILHCHDELSWFYGTLAAWLGGASRVLVTMHGRRPDISTRHLYEQRVLTSATTAIISVSSYLSQQLLNEIRVAPRKLVTIRNGVPLVPMQPEQEQRRQARKVLGLREDAIVVGCVGRLAAVKNLDLLIAAAAAARAVVPNLHVVLIGEGPCQARLVRRVAALGLNEVVTFTGLRQDVAELLPGLDLYVCSSDYEGVSLSVLEAMVAARAVIATAVGGNSEIVRHNETGILVEKGNRQALAQAIIELSHDETRRSVEVHYGIERMIRDYDRLYQAVLAGRSLWSTQRELYKEHDIHENTQRRKENSGTAQRAL
jgi:glycosyltransferase involved in cell wall biosynthesis